MKKKAKKAAARVVAVRLISDAEQRSKKLTAGDAALILHLVHLGFQHKRIAGLFDVNQGRIAEIVGRANLPRPRE